MLIGINPARRLVPLDQTDLCSQKPCAFLSHLFAACRQVRMLAAGLVEVGHGRMSPQQLAEVMESGDR